jgi:hypothetical protein
MQLTVVPSSPSAFLVDLCDEPPDSKARSFFTFVCLVTLAQWAITMVRTVKWVLELVSDYLYIKSKVQPTPEPKQAAAQAPSPQPREAPEPLVRPCMIGTVWSLDFSDPGTSVHLYPKCFQTKGREMHAKRSVCGSCCSKMPKEKVR